MKVGDPPRELRSFVGNHDEVEAVVQRIGHGTWDLLLIDVGGNWVRWVVPSDAVAKTMCDALGVRLHRGWEEDPRMARRMNALDAWATPGARRRAT